MTAIIYDIECNGLLYEAREIFCIGVKINDEETLVYTSRPMSGSSGSINDAISIIRSGDIIVGHNVVKFDNAVIRKLYTTDFFGSGIKHFDTLIASQLRYPNMVLIDSNNKTIDPKLKGKHSLASWGQRLGYAKGDHDDWSCLSHEMMTYCKRDVDVTYKLYNKLKDEVPEEAMRLEQKFAYIIGKQEEYGVLFDVEAARKLHVELLKEQEEAIDNLYKTFKPLLLPNGSLKTPSKSFTRLGVTTVGEHQPIVLTTFNPKSGHHIVWWIEKLYGKQKWLLTEKGSPKTGEDDLLRMFEDKEWAKPLVHYLQVKKLLGQLAEGSNAWLVKVRDDNRIHGEVNTIGAVSRRCTHCVPMSTKALTKDGWKGYDELVVGEYVLGYNLQTEKQEWTKVTDKHYFNNADVGLIGNKGNQLKCTADHKWVVMKRNRSELGYGNPRLVKASEIKHHDAILMNADYTGYSDMNLNIPERLPTSKYAGYNHMLEVLNYSQKELRAYLHGFLLADGYFKKSASGKLHSWSFAQAEGDILEASHLALYLFSNKRCSRTCKTPLKVDNQRFGYNITQTNKPYIRAKTGTLEWRYTSTEDVWCPTTELGTWVMKQDDGIITITGNSNPNLAQVPSVRGYKGKECRSLFIVPEGRAVVGCDMSGLELRIFAHYLARYDKGNYAKVILNEDIHTFNQKAFGVPTRDTAKTTIYGVLYGAGSEKVGSIVGKDAKEGTKIKKNFEKNVPAYKSLITDVGNVVKTKGYLKAIDGNNFFIRSEHSALNTLLQGTGALLCKQWCIITYDRLIELGYKWKDDFAYILNIHDEFEIECREELAEEIADIAKTSTTLAGEYFKLRIRIDGEAKVGRSWADVH